MQVFVSLAQLSVEGSDGFRTRKDLALELCYEHLIFVELQRLWVDDVLQLLDSQLKWQCVWLVLLGQFDTMLLEKGKLLIYLFGVRGLQLQLLAFTPLQIQELVTPLYLFLVSGQLLLELIDIRLELPDILLKDNPSRQLWLQGQSLSFEDIKLVMDNVWLSFVLGYDSVEFENLGLFFLQLTLFQQ